MAIHATNFVGSVRPCHPVANFLIPRVTTQADAVSVRGGTISKGDDFGNVPAALHVQAAGTVALLAFHALLGMIRMPKILSDVGMTRSCLLYTSKGCLNKLVAKDASGKKRSIAKDATLSMFVVVFR